MRVPTLFGVSALLLLVVTSYALIDLWRQETVLRRIEETRKSHEAASNELNTTMLLARAGLLRNYDAIVSASDRAMASLREIDALDAGMPEIGEVVGHARERQNSRQMLIEQFKSENALLQNSLVYFSALSKSLQQALPEEGSLATDVGVLAASILAFTLNPSDDNAETVQAAISRLRASTAEPPQAGSVDSLVAHAQLIQSTLAGVDRLVQSVLAGTGAGGVADAIAAAEERHATLMRTYLIAFSIAAALAASACVAVGFQLRTKIRTSRARKELGVIIADMTLRSINAGTTQLDTIIEEALRRVAAWAGADRARYVSTDSRRIRYDSMPGSPPGSSGILEQFALHDAGRDFIYVRRGRAITDTELSRAILGSNVATWFCYRSGEARRGSLLTLERQRGSFLYGEDVLNLLRGSLDAISDAIDRVIQKAEQRALEARLNQAQRLEAVGTFASGIAHNLNNITATIRGHAEMAGEAQHKQTLDRHIREILKSADRAHDAVSEIMAFGHSDQMSRKRTDLAALACDALRLLSANIPASVRLQQSMAQSVFASVDPRQIEQVLFNLVRNACQAIGPRDGVVQIGVETREQSSAVHLSHGVAEPGRYAVLTVSDNGEGMDQPIHDRLFEPFFSTRETGNGLGLATVKRIVAEHRGTLDVRSEMGHGSTISVWLQVDDAHDAESPPGQGSGKRILLVGRDRAERLKLEETVAAFGYEPVGFSDKDRALDTLSTSAFDALLLLTRRSDADGYPALLKAVGRGLPVVIVGNADTISQMADGAGVVDVVRRPVVPALLALSLAKAAQQGVVLKSSAISRS